jgi:hypothetical protein
MLNVRLPVTSDMGFSTWKVTNRSLRFRNVSGCTYSHIKPEVYSFLSGPRPLAYVVSVVCSLWLILLVSQKPRVLSPRGFSIPTYLNVLAL